MRTALECLYIFITVFIGWPHIRRKLKWRKGKQLWSQTWKGLKFYFDDPQPDMVCIEDIAHCLSNVCRFTGNVDRFYSVGQHSLIISQLLEAAGHSPEVQLQGLLHDSPEAYINDLSRCLKRSPGMEGYREIEDRIWRAISRKFGLCFVLHPAIKELDIRMVATEHRDLFTNFVPWDEFYDETLALDFKIAPQVPANVEREFLRRYHELAQKLS